MRNILFGVPKGRACDNEHRNTTTQVGNIVDAESFFHILCLCPSLKRLDLCLPPSETLTSLGRGSAALLDISSIHGALLLSEFSLKQSLRHLRILSWPMGRQGTTCSGWEGVGSIYGVLNALEGLKVLELFLESKGGERSVVRLDHLPNVRTLSLCGGVGGICLQGKFGYGQRALRQLRMHSVMVSSVEELEGILPTGLEGLQLSYISTAEDFGEEAIGDFGEAGMDMGEIADWEFTGEEDEEEDEDGGDFIYQHQVQLTEQENMRAPERHLNLSGLYALKHLSLASSFVTWTTVASACRELSELCIGGRTSFGDYDESAIGTCAWNALNGMKGLKGVCLWEVGCGMATGDVVEVLLGVEEVRGEDERRGMMELGGLTGVWDEAALSNLRAPG